LLASLLLILNNKFINIGISATINRVSVASISLRSSIEIVSVNLKKNIYLISLHMPILIFCISPLSSLPSYFSHPSLSPPLFLDDTRGKLGAATVVWAWLADLGVDLSTAWFLSAMDPKSVPYFIPIYFFRKKENKSFPRVLHIFSLSFRTWQTTATCAQYTHGLGACIRRSRRRWERKRRKDGFQVRKAQKKD
jgi:hypothetical protein